MASYPLSEVLLTHNPIWVILTSLIQQRRTSSHESVSPGIRSILERLQFAEPSVYSTAFLSLTNLNFCHRWQRRFWNWAAPYRCRSALSPVDRFHSFPHRQVPYGNPTSSQILAETMSCSGTCSSNAKSSETSL